MMVWIWTDKLDGRTTGTWFWPITTHQPALLCHTTATNWWGRCAWSQPNAASRGEWHPQKKALCAIIFIHEHTDAHDWLVMLRLTWEESEWAIPPTQRAWPVFDLLNFLPQRAAASRSFKFEISGQILFCCATTYPYYEQEYGLDNVGPQCRLHTI